MAKSLTQSQIDKLISQDKELPESLASVGGYLYLNGYNHPLPESLKNAPAIK